MEKDSDQDKFMPSLRSIVKGFAVQMPCDI